MTALEARTLTDARRAESELDYLMRDKVYPAIEARASCGYDTAGIQGLWAGPFITLQRDIKEEIGARLRADGFTVTTRYDIDLGPVAEVSW